MLYEYDVEVISNDTYSPQRSEVKVTEIKEFIANEEFYTYDYPSITFSGNGEELYFSNVIGIKKLLPEEKFIAIRGDHVASGIYSIPNSSGIVYWLQDNPNLNSHYFIIDYGDTFKEVDIHPQFSMDVLGDIILSPNSQNACIEWQASGSRNSSLFDLNSGNSIPGGEGCIGWISNTQVVLNTSNTYAGDQGYVLYYLFDLIAKKKTFLHDSNPSYIY